MTSTFVIHQMIKDEVEVLLYEFRVMARRMEKLINDRDDVIVPFEDFTMRMRSCKEDKMKSTKSNYLSKVSHLPNHKIMTPFISLWSSATSSKRKTPT